MAAKKDFTYDQKSHFLVEHFSVILNHMLPVEYIYSNWYEWIARGQANRSDPNYAGGWSSAVIETGSCAEGFCIPKCLIASPEMDIFHSNPNEMEHWEPDIDLMTENDFFVRCENYRTSDVGGANGKVVEEETKKGEEQRDITENGGEERKKAGKLTDKLTDKDEQSDNHRDKDQSKDLQDTNCDKDDDKDVCRHATTVDTIPIFSVSHIKQDPRYVKLLFTPEWKTICPKYNHQEFLHHSFLFPTENTLFVNKMNENENPRRQWTQEVHGPVLKMESKADFPKYETDETNVFKYPQAWPEVAMDWIIRPRSGSWPLQEVIKDIVESGCHIAPVGRGKRHHTSHEDKDVSDAESCFMLTKDQEADKPHAEDNSVVMDSTEWRISFSVAENKLGQSVTPLQRHIIVLLKMLKKCYFPSVVSSYHLKNLLFWEIDKNDESFWNEDESAKCLVFMLDRLEECLKDGVLLHYIIPQSNLLEGESRDVLTKAAEEVREVRMNIVEKSFTMLKRVLTMSFQSRAFQRDLNLEPLILRLQNISNIEDVKAGEENEKHRDTDKEQDKDMDRDKKKNKEDAIDNDELNKDNDSEKQQLLFALYRAFIPQYQQCLDELNMIRSDATIEREVDISINLYQSLLARTLIKLWLSTTSHNTDISQHQDILTFIKLEIPDDYINVEFLRISMTYVAHAQEKPDLSSVVPQVLEKTKEIYRNIAQENFDEFRNPMLRVQSVFQSGDVQELVKILHELGLSDIDPNNVTYVPPNTK